MDTYVFDAVRSPRGKARPDGGLAGLKPHALVGQLIAALDERTPGAAAQADALLLGCVGQIGDQGGNVALVTKLYAGLPQETAAWSLNNYCVSGLTAIGQAAARIAAGQARSALAGGVEMMSRVGFMADKADYYTDPDMPAQARYVPVAVAADRLAQRWQLTRGELDEAAYRSQSRAAAAEADARLNASRIAIRSPDGKILDRDECIRPAAMEMLTGLAPAFGELKTNYAEALGDVDFAPMHTIAHAPPMCDGAGLALVGVQGAFDRAPRARIVAYAEAGGDPAESLGAGFTAMARVLKASGLQLSDFDRIEFMEAFGATIARFLRAFEVDSARVNVAGGHIARGHPLGASGAILLSTLLDNLEAAGGRFGLVVATGATGVGAAMIVELQDA